MLNTLKQVNSKKIKILLSFLVSGIFSYFAFRGVEFGKVIEIIQRARPLYIAAIVAVIVFAQILRSLRWGVLLQPIEPLSQRLLFPLTSIGFMFIVLMPARLGEIARPYLLQQNTRISFGSATATVVLERILDAIFILCLFAVSISFIDVPKWIIDFAKVFTLILLLIIGLLIMGSLTKTQRTMNKIIEAVLPVRFAALAKKIIETFYSGMSALGKRRHTLIIIMLSALIWGALVLTNWLLFRALDMNLGYLAAIYVLVLTMLGISVPAGPGFIGSYHFACVLALSFFGINKEIAIGYALFLHVLSIGTILILGILSLISSRVSISAFLFQKK